MSTLLDLDELNSQVEQARSVSRYGQPAGAARRYRLLRARVDASDDDRREVDAVRAQVMLGLAAAQFELSGRLDDAMHLLDDAERLAARAQAPAVTAAVLGQRGHLLVRGGHQHEALRAFDAAAGVRHAASRFDALTIVLNRGLLHLEIGSLDQAERDFHECVAGVDRARERDLYWKARHNLAYVDFLRGRIPRALAAMEEIEHEIDPALQPIVVLDRARVLREAGLGRDAEQLLARAGDELRAASLVQDVGETELVRAECALVDGRTGEARDLARSASRLFVRRGNLQWQRKAQLLVLRCERARAESLESPRRGAAYRRVAGRAQLLAATCLAEQRADLARPAELLAQECLLRAAGSRVGPQPGPVEQSPPVVRPDDSLETRLHAREVRALAACRRGDLTAAAAEVRRGLGELGRYQSGFGSLDLRTASAVHGLPLARLGLEVACRRGSAAEFFAAVERARAVSTRLRPVGPPSDDRTAALLSELRRVEEDARTMEGDPSAAAERGRLRALASSLQREMRARAWELEGGTQPSTRAAAARVSQVRRAAALAGTDLVCFVVHAGRYRAVVASRSRPVVHDLAAAGEVTELVLRARADLDALAIPRLPPPLADAVRRSLTSVLRRLDDLLLRPLGVAGRPLVVSCASTLGLLPWSLLPSRRRLPVVVTSSATGWLRRGPGGRPDRPRVVSVAGPGLARAGAEAVAVHRAWPGARLLVGRGASTGAVAEGLAHADVVHVAGHGTHQPQSPLFSSLRLADGALYAYELDADGRAAPCVVLSACEAGLATPRPGEEVLGLTSVLLHLGSRSVLAGVAKVGDDVAERVMTRAHQAMATGTDSAAALAESLADEETPAPFVCFGSTW